MAGVLSFSIQCDPAEFVQGTNQATTAANKFNSSVKVTPETLHQIKDASKLTAAATHALSGAMANIGFAVAPQLTSQLMGVSGALKSLQKVASASGVGIPGIGVAALGVAAAFFTWSKAIEAVNAGLKETSSAESLDKQFKEKLRPSLLKEIDQLVGRGRMTEEKGAGLKNELNSGNPEIERKAQKEVQSAGITSNEKDTQIKNRATFSTEAEQYKIEAIADPKQRALAEIDKLFDDIKEKLIEKASTIKDSGPLLNDALKDVETTRKRKKDEVEEKFNPDEKVVPEIKIRPQVTDWERIGLAFNGGATGNDHAKATAENTRNMLGEQKKTNQLLATRSGTVDLANAA